MFDKPRQFGSSAGTMRIVREYVNLTEVMDTKSKSMTTVGTAKKIALNEFNQVRTEIEELYSHDLCKRMR